MYFLKAHILKKDLHEFLLEAVYSELKYVSIQLLKRYLRICSILYQSKAKLSHFQTILNLLRHISE